MCQMTESQYCCAHERHVLRVVCLPIHDLTSGNQIFAVSSGD